MEGPLYDIPVLDGVASFSGILPSGSPRLSSVDFPATVLALYYRVNFQLGREVQSLNRTLQKFNYDPLSTAEIERILEEANSYWREAIARSQRRCQPINRGYGVSCPMPWQQDPLLGLAHRGSNGHIHGLGGRSISGPMPSPLNSVEGAARRTSDGGIRGLGGRSTSSTMPWRK